MSDVRYWIWLATLPGLTDRQRWRLLEAWKTPQGVFDRSLEEIAAAAELRPGQRNKLKKTPLSAAEGMLSRCREKHIFVLPYDDPCYPRRLADIFAPPLVLYGLGQRQQLDDEAAVAVVGTRKASPYGVRMAERMGGDLAALGLTVVSGMAKGIDGCALRGALRAGGYAVAVLGSGVDVVYPAENRELYDELCRRGTVLSAYPPGTKPDRWHFPERNRIISGVSLGTLVVEAPAGHSGALLTADHAAEQGRDVFALPGSVENDASAGCLELLRQGALLASSAEDVAAVYRYRFPHKIKPSLPRRKAAPAEEKPVPQGAPAEEQPYAPDPGLTAPQQAILRALSPAEPRLMDEVALATGLPVTAVMAELTLLEIDGYVTKHGAQSYLRAENP
ncbi:MAG: DNA-processing protein DprA [Oscillospiraceae bacterium]|nr:DNA-processing protein DprA [Oscillospiraceae bacterium]